MAKKKTRKSSGINTAKLMKYIRLLGLAGPGAFVAIQPDRSMQSKLGEIIALYTGYNANTGAFDPVSLARGWTPFLATVGVTYGIPKLAGMIRGL